MEMPRFAHYSIFDTTISFPNRLGNEKRKAVSIKTYAFFIKSAKLNQLGT